MMFQILFLQHQVGANIPGFHSGLKRDSIESLHELESKLL